MYMHLGLLLHVCVGGYISGGCGLCVRGGAHYDS